MIIIIGGICILIFGILTFGLVNTWYFLLSETTYEGSYQLLGLQSIIGGMLVALSIFTSKLLAQKKPFNKIIPFLIIIAFLLAALIFVTSYP